MKHFIVVKLMGRCGNQFYQIATGLAYAKEHELDFYATSVAENCDENAYYFRGFPTRDQAGFNYEEKRHESVNGKMGNAYYAPIPKMNNVFLLGFWQSFKYFDAHRQHILESFKIPYEMQEGVVSIHVRRGDYLVPNSNFPSLDIEYYRKAINHMNELGCYRFMVFSDDIAYCKELFTDDNFPNPLAIAAESGNIFGFSEGATELEDLSLMNSCEHNIIANSSFSFVAAWLNQNPNKIVLCPDREHLFVGCCDDMIPEYFTQLTV
jgi:hypothetical protein